MALTPFFLLPSMMNPSRSFFEDDEDLEMMNAMLESMAQTRQRRRQLRQHGRHGHSRGQQGQQGSQSAAGQPMTGQGVVQGGGASTPSHDQGQGMAGMEQPMVSSGKFQAFPTQSLGMMTPSMMTPFVPLMHTDLIEKDDEFNVHVDLPGVDVSDLDISVVDNALLIQAERKHVHEVKNDRVHNMERVYGKVRRQISLPENADLDAARSSFKNGVLNISVPKKATMSEKKRKLTIETD